MNNAPSSAADGDITGIGSGRGENSLPACLSMAVAYLCKRRKSDPLLSGRVLAFQACADQPAGYIPLMNCAFLWCVADFCSRRRECVVVWESSCS